MSLRIIVRTAFVLALVAALTSLVHAFPLQTQTSAAAAQASTGSTLLILNKIENTLAIVDPVSLKVLGKVPTGEGPHEVVASADGRIAYVANYGTQQKVGNSISIIDIAARREIKRLELGPLFRPHGIVLSNGKVYFTAEVN
ncbi:MAG TPA: hypothetical protein VEQ40_04190, partial [Pyrinomonadaceae bacterium]|nr:hypothetical protein [Pyrinomonadaceae bacterium]